MILAPSKRLITPCARCGQFHRQRITPFWRSNQRARNGGILTRGGKVITRNGKIVTAAVDSGTDCSCCGAPGCEHCPDVLTWDVTFYDGVLCTDCIVTGAPPTGKITVPSFGPDWTDTFTLAQDAGDPCRWFFDDAYTDVAASFYDEDGDGDCTTSLLATTDSILVELIQLSSSTASLQATLYDSGSDYTARLFERASFTNSCTTGATAVDSTGICSHAISSHHFGMTFDCEADLTPG